MLTDIGIVEYASPQGLCKAVRRKAASAVPWLVGILDVSMSHGNYQDIALDRGADRAGNHMV